MHEVDSHWFLAVVDLEERTAYVLDSLPEANIARRRIKVQEIVSKITNSRNFSVCSFLLIASFRILGQRM